MTPKAQRIGILVIAVVMIVGTIGSFGLMILATSNQNAEQEKLANESQDRIEKQQKEVKELSSTYFPIFGQYAIRPAAFDASSVGDTVTYVDVKEGDGETITKDSIDYRAYYLGWNPSGKVFDGSINGEELKPPLDLSQVTLLPGWYDGVDGMKVGGIREITIPSNLAYGEKGQGDDIPPNTPIKFLIMAIPAA